MTTPEPSAASAPAPNDDAAVDSTDAASRDAGKQDAAAPDTKAQFRAALERKRQQQHPGAAGASGKNHGHGAHGAAAGGQRMFRRKSG